MNTQLVTEALSILAVGVALYCLALGWRVAAAGGIRLAWRLLSRYAPQHAVAVGIAALSLVSWMLVAQALESEVLAIIGTVVSIAAGVGHARAVRGRPAYGGSGHPDPRPIPLVQVCAWTVYAAFIAAVAALAGHVWNSTLLASATEASSLQTLVAGSVLAFVELCLGIAAAHIDQWVIPHILGEADRFEAHSLLAAESSSRAARLISAEAGLAEQDVLDARRAVDISIRQAPLSDLQDPTFVANEIHAAIQRLKSGTALGPARRAELRDAVLESAVQVTIAEGKLASPGDEPELRGVLASLIPQISDEDLSQSRGLRVFLDLLAGYPLRPCRNRRRSIGQALYTRLRDERPILCKQPDTRTTVMQMADDLGPGALDRGEREAVDELLHSLLASAIPYSRSDGDLR